MENNPDLVLPQLSKLGYISSSIDKNIDLPNAIQQLKKEKNAVLLAHYYQEPEIQELADYLGDSLYLAQQAAQVEADIIVFAGVHFMAETAKIINPSKKVILPDLKAGCSLADSCPPSDFAAFKAQHPDAIVVTYIRPKEAKRKFLRFINNPFNKTLVNSDGFNFKRST